MRVFLIPVKRPYVQLSSPGQTEGLKGVVLRNGWMADSWRIHGGFMADSWRIHGGFMANGFAKVETVLDMR